jgi:hypothetical protein
VLLIFPSAVRKSFGGCTLKFKIKLLHVYFLNQSCAGECTSQISLQSTDKNFSADDEMGRNIMRKPQLFSSEERQINEFCSMTMIAIIIQLDYVSDGGCCIYK